MTKATNKAKGLDLNIEDLGLDLDFADLQGNLLDFGEEEVEVEGVNDLEKLLTADEEEVEVEGVNDLEKLLTADEEEAQDEEIEEEFQLPKETKKRSVPVAKPTTKATPKTATHGEEVIKVSSTAKKGKTKVRKTISDLNYESLFEGVEAKVNKYNEIMEARSQGKTKEIPQSPVISKDLLIALLTARSNELINDGLKLSVMKAMVSMGYDRDEAVEEVQKYKFKRAEIELIYNSIIDVVYEIISAGSGISLFKTEDCNATIAGKWVEQRVLENAHLNTDKASLIQSYLRVESKSPAPANKKQLGKIENGKFVPLKK